MIYTIWRDNEEYDSYDATREAVEAVCDALGGLGDGYVYCVSAVPLPDLAEKRRQDITQAITGYLL